MKIFERETYNDVIEVLIEDNLELNEKTKREMEKRKKNPKLLFIPTASSDSEGYLKVVEKHFTLDKNMTGPDHWFSADPKELKQLVRGIRYIEKSMGGSVIRPTLKEQKMRKVARRSIVAKKNIKTGEEITFDYSTVVGKGSN